MPTSAKKYKSATGRDDIATKLCKAFDPYTDFATGIFISQLKIAQVILVFKRSSKTCLSKYRPISLFFSFSKIIEKLATNDDTTFCNRKNFSSLTVRISYETINLILHAYT